MIPETLKNKKKLVSICEKKKKKKKNFNLQKKKKKEKSRPCSKARTTGGMLSLYDRFRYRATLTHRVQRGRNKKQRLSIDQ